MRSHRLALGFVIIQNADFAAYTLASVLLLFLTKRLGLTTETIKDDFEPFVVACAHEISAGAEWPATQAATRVLATSGDKWIVNSFHQLLSLTEAVWSSIIETSEFDHEKKKLLSSSLSDDVLLPDYDEGKGPSEPW